MLFPSPLLSDFQRRKEQQKSKDDPERDSLRFPRVYSRDSVNLKDDLVRRYKKRGRKVVFVGGGTSDFPAIESADVRFAIRGSSLAELCDRRGVQCS